MTHPIRTGLARFSLAIAAMISASGAFAQEVITNGTIEGGSTPLTQNPNITGTLANGWTENTWQTGPGTYSVKYAIDTSKKYAGKASLSVTSVNAKPQFYAPILLKRGYKYTATLYLRANTAQEVQVQLRPQGSPYTTYGMATPTLPTPTLLSAGWTKVTLEGDAPLNADDVWGGLFIVAQTPGTIWVDNVSVIQAPATQAIVRKGQSFAKDYFGIHVHRDPNWPDLGGTVGADRFWDGEGVQLSSIFPTSDLSKANWTKFDARIARAQQNGADMLMVLGGNIPKWASSDPTGNDYTCSLYSTKYDANGNRIPNSGVGEGAPPKDRTVWKNMVKAVVARAAGRIKYWEVWNEPYICGQLNLRRPTDNVKYLVDLANDAATIIKANGNPNKLVVLSPSFALERLDYVDQYLAQGGGNYFDVVSVHAYDYFLEQRLGSDPSTGRADAPETMFVREHNVLNLKNILNKYNLGSKPIWDTESGYSVDTNPVDRTGNDTLGAPYVARHLLLTSLAGMDRTYYYSWDHRENIVALSRELNGVGNGSTKGNAGLAYQSMAKWLTGAQVIDVVSPSTLGAPWTVKLKRTATGTTEYIVWEPTGTTVDYPLPAGMSYVSSLLGPKSLVTGPVKVNGWPQLLTGY